MKTHLIATLLLAATGFAFAHDGHDHSHEKKDPAAAAKAHDHAEEKAPNGGRMIHSVDPHAEFLFTAERKVEIRFVDHGEVIAPSGQVVTLVGGDRAKPTRLSFAVEGDKLVSSDVLPEGENLPIILQIKPAGGGKTVTERFTLNLAQCPTCEHQEYACTCAHGGGGHKHSHGDGHDHKH